MLGELHVFPSTNGKSGRAVILSAFCIDSLVPKVNVNKFLLFEFQSIYLLDCCFYVAFCVSSVWRIELISLFVLEVPFLPVIHFVRSFTTSKVQCIKFSVLFPLFGSVLFVFRIQLLSQISLRLQCFWHGGYVKVSRAFCEQIACCWYVSFSSYCFVSVTPLWSHQVRVGVVVDRFS